MTGAASDEEPRVGWRSCIDTVETSDARLAAPLFRKSFGHPVPPMPRHYVMFYRPPAAQGSDSGQPLVIGYTHQLAFENVYLAGGMCVDPTAYRMFPRWLFDEVKREGGLATLIMKESFATLEIVPPCSGTSATGVRALPTFARDSSTRAGRI